MCIADYLNYLSYSPKVEGKNQFATELSSAVSLDSEKVKCYKCSVSKARE